MAPETIIPMDIGYRAANRVGMTIRTGCVYGWESSSVMATMIGRGITPELRCMAGGTHCRGIGTDNRINRANHRGTRITGRIDREVMTGITGSAMLV